MAEVIRMNFEYMDELRQAYGELAEALDSASMLMLSIDTLLHDGALLGSTGDRLSEGFLALSGSMKRIAERHREQAEDILHAKDAMERSDTEAGQFYQ